MRPSLKEHLAWRQWYRSFVPPPEPPKPESVRRKIAGYWVLQNDDLIDQKVAVCHGKPGWLARLIVFWLLRWKWREPKNVTSQEMVDHFEKHDPQPYGQRNLGRVWEPSDE